MKTKKNDLTIKQEGFCQDYIRTGNATEAYRLNYSYKNMKESSVNRLAKALIDNIKISSRIDSLRKESSKAFNIDANFMTEKYINALNSAIAEDDYKAQATILDSLSKFLGNSKADEIKIKLLEQKSNEDKKDSLPIQINIDV